MAIFSLMGRVGLDTRGFTRGLASVRAQTREAAVATTREFGGAFKSAVLGFIGVAGASQILNQFKQIANEAAAIRNRAFSTQLTLSDAQALQYVAEQSGKSFSNFTETIELLAQAQSKLRGGDLDVAAALEQLKVNVEQFSELQTPIALLLTFADGVGQSEKSLDSLIAKTKIIGGQAKELGAVLENDFAGNYSVGKALAIDDKTVVDMAKVSDELTKLSYQTKSIWSEAGPRVLSFLGQTVAGGKALLDATAAGLGNLTVTGSITDAAIAAVDDFMESADRYDALKKLGGSDTQGVIDKINKNASGAPLVIPNNDTTTNSDPFQFTPKDVSDRFTKYGFSLSGSSQNYFVPPVMKDQLNELQNVKREISSLKDLVGRKL